MMMKGPVRDLIPIGKQMVRLRVPAGRVVARVRLLAAGTDPELRTEGGDLIVRVPSVLDHEVVAVDLR